MGRISRRKCRCLAAAAAVVLTACANDAPLPDPLVDPLVTRSVAIEPGATGAAPDMLASAGTARSDEESDAMVMANAAAAIAPGGGPVNWQNPLTGSSGFIHGLAEAREASGLCRSFAALRNSYDGARNYAARICMDERGAWRLMAFDKL